MKLVLLTFCFCVAQIVFSQAQFVTLQQSVENQRSELKKSPNNVELLGKLVDSYNLNSQYSAAEDAISTFEKSVNKRDRHKLALIYLAYAKTYKYAGKTEEAIYYFLKAEETFIALKDFEGLVQCGVEIVEFHRRTVNFIEAEKQYYKYLYIAKKRQIKNLRSWNGLYNRFAAVLNETSRPHASIVYSEKAIEVAEKLGDLNALAISYNELGFTYKNIGMIDESLDAYVKAESNWMKLGYYRDGIQAKMNRLMLEIHSERMSHTAVLVEFHKLLNTIDSFQVDCPKSGIYHEIATAHWYNKDYLAAYDALSLYHAHEIGEYDRKRASELNNIVGKYRNHQLAQENERVVIREKHKQQQLATANDRIAIIVIALFILVLAFAALFFLWGKLKLSNNLLVKRNQQKTVLVQEIHHRVKNNLQFVRSIIEMESNLNTSDEGSQSLNDVMRRVDAMSLVHEILYIEEEVMSVSMNLYLEKLIGVSRVMYNHSTDIQLDLEIDAVELPIDKIVSIGIICSELLSNSIKHAFVLDDSPRFSISLKNTGQSYLLSVSDNGTENPNVTTEKRFGLGMRLIDIFSRQLNGTYTISKENGYRYELKFKN